MGIHQQVVKKVDDKLWKVRPYVTNEQVKEIAYECFGLKVDGEVEEIVSYEDRNFLLKGKNNTEK